MDTAQMQNFIERTEQILSSPPGTINPEVISALISEGRKIERALETDVQVLTSKRKDQTEKLDSMKAELKSRFSIEDADLNSVDSLIVTTSQELASSLSGLKGSFAPKTAPVETFPTDQAPSIPSQPEMGEASFVPGSAFQTV